MRRNQKRHKIKSEQSYWQSYSDMMAALLLMFILIMSFVLVQSYQMFEKKQQQIEEKQKQIVEQQEEIEALVGVKADIIMALSEAFKESNLTIEIDKKTGAITLDSSVLYEFNSAELSADGQKFLKDFLPLYISVIMRDEYKPYVSEIIIEGHTDPVGSYMYNLDLSQRRAFSVAEYCLDTKYNILEEQQVQELRKLMTANGKAYSDPVYDSNGVIDDEKSRRVEIKFRLQDEEMIERLQEILKGTTE